MIFRSFIAFIFGLIISTDFVRAGSTKIEVFEFSQLLGWSRDDHQKALDTFLVTCQNLKAQDWQTLCALGQSFDDAKLFFEAFFKPVKISDGNNALFTGYYEPELSASHVKTDRFQYPIYKAPSELQKTKKWYSRKQIETGNYLQNRSLEIAWLEDPVEVMFLQIQGSGRLRFSDGSILRVGYGGSNGHKYKSIGKEMVRQGILKSHQASAKSISSWVAKDPQNRTQILWNNPSFVFFRVVESLSDYRGPIGAMNRSITPLRSLAVDPRFVPLGAPVWLEKKGKSPMRRLMVAQDTGSVIKGAQRADIFYGSGEQAGKKARAIKDDGSLFVLLPVKRALNLMLGQ